MKRKRKNDRGVAEVQPIKSCGNESWEYRILYDFYYYNFLLGQGNIITVYTRDALADHFHQESGAKLRGFVWQGALG